MNNKKRTRKYKNFIFDEEEMDGGKLFISAPTLSGFVCFLNKDEDPEQFLIPAMEKYIEYVDKWKKRHLNDK